MATIIPFTITIAGGTASGKSTLAKMLREHFGSQATALCLDSYYHDQVNRPMSERVKTNYDHPDSIDFTLLKEHLTALKAGKSAVIPVYDFTQHTRNLEKTETLASTPIIILEGILSLWHPELRRLSNLKIFVETPPEVRFERRLERDIRERGRTPACVALQWKETVEPMFQHLCAPTALFADLVVDGSKPLVETFNYIMKKL